MKLGRELGGQPSARTRAFGIVTLIVWACGVVLGLFVAPNDVAANASDMMLLGTAVASAVIIGVSAMASRPKSMLRIGWLLVATSIAVGGAAAIFLLWAALSPDPHARFDCASPALMLCLVPGAGATWSLALSMRGARHFGAHMTRSLAVAAGVWVLMIASLLAPGPGMPWSIGPRDPLAVSRVTIDCFLLLWPALLCALASLEAYDQPRVRVWVWFAAGVLMLAWGDVVVPLVELGTAQVYPAMLWCLGVILMATAASRHADFEHDALDPQPAN